MSVTEYSRMRGVVFHCGQYAPALPEPENFTSVVVPSPPVKTDIDPCLKDVDRVVVVGKDTDLAAVVVRLLRRELLGTISIGYVPIENSVAGRRWQLPSHLAEAFSLALKESPKPVPLIRDDAGGVLIGQGLLEEVQGEAYCDEHLLLRGKARSIVVEPGADGVSAYIATGSLLRKKISATGRAFQVGCHPAKLTLNGQLHERPVQRWTWYRHTEDLLLVQGEVDTAPSARVSQ